MLIAIFAGLLLIALIAVLLKRRHDRKLDKPREGFNAGITTRSTPMTAVDRSARGARGATGDGAADASYVSRSETTLEPGSGRDGPARTRDAFMPYGYAYARSESRLGSRTDVAARRSPMPRGGTPVGELEKEAGIMRAETPESAPAKRQKRVLIRERSVQGPESPEVEKQYQ